MAGVAMVLPGTATAVEPESGQASEQTQSQQSTSPEQGQAASPEQSQSAQSQQSQKGQKTAESSKSAKQGKSGVSAKGGLQPRGGGMVVGPQSVCTPGTSTFLQCFTDTYGDSAGSVVNAVAYSLRPPQYVNSHGAAGPNIFAVVTQQMLDSITSLSLHNGPIDDLGNIRYMHNLQSLDTNDNRDASFTDLSGLSGLSNLRTLVIHRAGVTDFSPLGGLSLSYFSVSQQVRREAAYDDGQYVTLSTADVKNADGSYVTPTNISYGGVYDSAAHVVRWPTGTTGPQFSFADTVPIAGVLPSGIVVGNSVTHVTGHPTVRFDSQGGSIVPDQEVPWGGTAHAPANPTKTHYMFEAWHTGSSTGPVYDFGTACSSATPLTLYASWVPAHYDVTFDLNGGTWNGTPQGAVSTAYDAMISEPSNLSHLKAPVHKQRSGWQYRKTDSTDNWAAFTFGSTHMPDYAITIRPTWEAIPRHVTYDKNGGSWSDMPASPVRVDEDDMVSQPSLTDFAPPSNKHQDTATSGWEYRKTGAPSTDPWLEFKFGVTHVPAYDITVRPKWVTDQYNVSYATGDGASWSSMPSGSTAYDYGSTIPTEPPTTGMTAPAHKHRDGWEYKASTGGWQTFTFGALGTGTEIPASNITIRPKWVMDQFNVSYEQGEATWAPVPAPAPYDYGSTIANAPATTGISFPAHKHQDGWQYRKTGSSDEWVTYTFGSTTLPAYPITIRPHVVWDSYDVKYEAGEAMWGSVPSGTTSHDYGSTIATAPNTTGITFPTHKHQDGWEYRETDGSGTWDTFTFGTGGSATTIPAHDITIRPHVVYDKYQVRYEDGGGTWALMPSGTTSYDYGSTIANEPNITGITAPSHKHRNGWEYRETGGSGEWDTYTFGSTTLPDHNITIRPKWVFDQYAVSYETGDANWPSVPPTATQYDYGSTIANPPATGDLTIPAHKHRDGWEYRKTGSSDSWVKFTFGTGGSATTIPDHPITIRPRVLSDQYDVSYEAGPGATWGSMPTGTTSYDYGSTIPSAPGTGDLTKPTHKHQSGWEYRETGSSASWETYIFGATTLPAHNITIRPKWVMDQFDVSYEQGEATWSGVPTGSTAYDYGSTIASAPSTMGITFPANKRQDGWEFRETGSMAAWTTFTFGTGGSATTIPDYAITIRPHVVWNSYDVKYEAGEATWSGVPTGTTAHDYGSTIASAPNTTGISFPAHKHQDGWEFRETGSSDSWTTFTFGTGGSATTIPAHNITIRPHVVFDQYTVTYQRGEATSWAGMPAATRYDYHSQLTVPGTSDLMAPQHKHAKAWQYSQDNGANWDSFTFGTTPVPAHDILIRPTFAWDQYNVSYETGDASWPGVPPTATAYDYGSTITNAPGTGDLTVPAHKHRDGWEYRETGSSAPWAKYTFGSTTLPDHNITIRPRVVSDQHDVSYEAGSGATWGSMPPGTTAYDYGSTIGSVPGTGDLNAPSHKQQSGWEYRKTGSSDDWVTYTFGATTLPDYDITIRPHWIWVKYNVSYEQGDATWASTPATAGHDYGSTIASAPNTTGITFPAHHHQDGWQYRETGSMAPWATFTFGTGGSATTIPDHAITIRPHVVIDQFTVSYSSGDATWSSVPTGTTQHDYGSTIASAPPTTGLTVPAHKNWNGWEYRETGGSGSWNAFTFGVTTIPDYNITIRPHVAFDQYRVGYESGTGASWATMPTGTTLHDYGSIIASAPLTSGIVAPAHKHQDGWEYRASSGGWQSYTFGSTTMPDSDITIRPKWVADKFPVSYEQGEAAWASVPPTPTQYDYGATIPSAPNTTGISFPAHKHQDGWEYRATGSNDTWATFTFGSTQIPDYAITIRPHVVFDQYRVGYEAGTGASWGSMPTGTTLHDYGSVIVSAPPTGDLTAPTNMHQDGWQYRASSGGWQDYTFGSTTMPDSDITIRPKWVANQYRVNYEAGDGATWSTMPTGTTPYDYGSTIPTPPSTSGIVAPTHKRQDGWEYHRAGSSAAWTDFTFGTGGSATTIPNYNITIRPKWVFNKYGVSYETGDATWPGVPSTTTQHDYGSVIASAPPTGDLTVPAHKNWNGWEYRETGSSASWTTFTFGVTTIPNHAITIRPHVQWDQYQVSYEAGDGASWLSIPAVSPYDYGSKISLAPGTGDLTNPANKHQDGWEFRKTGSSDEWAKYTFGTTTLPAHDITIRPHWVTDQYAVGYESGDGATWPGRPTGTTAYDYGSTIANAPSVSGITAPSHKHRDGWEYRETGSSAPWTTFTFGTGGSATTIPAHNITIRPHWVTDQFDVSYEAGAGATWSLMPSGTTAYDYGSTIPNAPSVAGIVAPSHKHQSGWEYRETGSSDDWATYTFGSTTLPDHNITIRPKWVMDQFDVGYEAGEATWSGVPTGTTAHDYGSTIASAPSTSGISFPAHKHQDGWEYREAASSAPWVTFKFGTGGSATTIPDHAITIRPHVVSDQFNVGYETGEATWSGVPGSTTAYDYGSVIPNAPSTAGISFPAHKHQDGWQFRKTGSSDEWATYTFGSTTLPAYDITIRPHVVLDQFNVGYELGDATSWTSIPLGTTAYNYGSTISMAPGVGDLTAPAHKRQDGWQFRKAGSSNPWATYTFGSTTLPAYDITIRPRIVFDKFNVSYENGGGTWAVMPSTPVAHDYGSTISSEPNTTGMTAPSHKHHSGWEYRKTGSSDTWVAFEFGTGGSATTVPDHAITIRPHWDWDQYNVSYAAGQATWSLMPTTPTAYDYGSTIATAPNTAGISFPAHKHQDGWEYRRTGGSGDWARYTFASTTLPDYAITIRPRVVFDQYRVSYQQGDGTWASMPGGTTLHDYGSTIATAPVTTGLTAPAHKHHAAWEYSQDNGASWADYTFGSTAMPAHDIIIRPTFALDQYRVGYQLNGATSWGSMPGVSRHDYGSVIASAPGTVDLAAPAHKHQSGWEYKTTSGGWQAFTFGTTTIPASDITIRPTFALDQYNVTYDVDGGSWAAMPGASPHDYGSTLAEPAGGYTKTGFLPRGWEYSTNGTDWNAFTFAGVHSTGTTIPAHDITIRPVWKAQLTITFDVEGGSAIAPRIVAEGDKFGQLPTPTRTGYRFDGWFVESMLRSLVPYDPNATISGNVTVVAQWTKIAPPAPSNPVVTTPPSSGWLETPEGHQWLPSQEGQHWLSTPQGHQWVSSDPGHAWLQTPQGHSWLNTPNGSAWLATPGGHQWLGTKPGQIWVSSAPGLAWLNTPAGQDWLKTPEGYAWLATPEGQKWLASRPKPKVVATTGSAVAVPMGLMVSAMIMALGLQIICRRRRGE
ncbi:InlB B-repeat-containing protein [Bifidobacterium sp. ESL0690]|uniref:InlB B-repeat-containing protein n=1 Tax=Bifidobacterium sp. ESL0690 TaxID=2983214 RepID=UPI0023F99DF4|nr:InlB B-repeat-containing protein [Bifidobacterium sp. ESL0690]WEV46538.1 InlB B-repeat-containing protein [Bifidobacterium sp. ESL0690]